MNEESTKRDQAAEIADEALDLDDRAERKAFIEGRCSGDEVLAGYVFEYLSAAELPDMPFGRYLGSHIGQWTLIKVLGEGGFGIVFLARRENPAQLAAIKLLKGTVHSRDVENRFRYEQQALAMLNHPNIVHLLDAGLTAERQSYVVMEYVEDAKTIDQYCRDKRMTIRQTIELFMKVCEAASYAHQKQIVHRDFKPGNILITADGRPKVVDFNLARLTNPADREGFVSRTGMLIGTQRYMSPEQVRRQPADTTSDVYSLGVVLYELLTGTDPYGLEARTGEMVERLIEDVTPLPASRAARLHSKHPSDSEDDTRNRPQEIKGDLDLILEMALRKEPERRYHSVEAFRDDLARYLVKEPIKAHPDSRRYRAMRFVRRNVGVTIGFSAFIVSLVLGLCGTVFEMRRAGREAQAVRQALIQNMYSDAIRSEAEDPNRSLAYVARILRTSPNFEADKITQFAAEWVVFSWQARWSPSLHLPHNRAIITADFSHDGRRVITGSVDSTAQLWNADTGAPLGSPFRHSARILFASFSPNGERVITASADGTAVVWDCESAKAVLGPFRHHGEVNTATYSPDGRYIVTASDDRTAQLWDARTGSRVGPALLHSDKVLSAAFDESGRRIVTASEDGAAQIWLTRTGRRLGVTMLHKSNYPTLSAAFSPDGRTVITTSANHTARLWDVASGRGHELVLRHSDRINTAAFSPDGRWILTSSDDGSAQVWEASTSTRATPPLQHVGHLYSATFSPDGRRILTASTEGAQIWSFLDTPVFRHQEGILFATFSPAGQHVATASADKSAQVWDSVTGSAIGKPVLHADEVNTAAFSPDGRRIVTASDDNTARLWNANTGEPVGTPLVHSDKVISASFHPDGRRVVTAANVAQMWDVDKGSPIEPMLHGGDVSCAAFSSDGKRLVTTAQDGTIAVWNTDSSRLVGKMFRTDGAPNCAAFSPDGNRFVVAADDGTARIWDLLAMNRAACLCNMETK